MNPQPTTTTPAPTNGNKPHCTICGLVLPDHKPDCKHNPANTKPAPATPAPAANNAPRITWSGLATTLKAVHLQGKPRTLTIKAVVFEMTHPQPGVEKKTACLYFIEQPQRFIPNEGNQAALLEMFGDDVAACKGKKITLAPVKWGKKQIMRIVRPGEGAPQAEPPAPGDEESIPF